MVVVVVVVVVVGGGGGGDYNRRPVFKEPFRWSFQASDYKRGHKNAIQEEGE